VASSDPGHGSAGNAMAIRESASPGPSTLADVDGDGRADLIAVSGVNNDVTAYRNQGWAAANGVYVSWDRNHVVSGFQP
jgi:hypothetical protein